VSRNLCTIRACSKDSTFMRVKLRGKCEFFSLTTPDPIPFCAQQGTGIDMGYRFAPFSGFQLILFWGRYLAGTQRRARFSFIVTGRQTAIDVSFSFPLASDPCMPTLPRCRSQTTSAGALHRARTSSHCVPIRGFPSVLPPQRKQQRPCIAFNSRPAAIRAFAGG